MNTPQPIGIFATPASREALLDYKSLFTVEREAADIGFTHFRSEDLEERIKDLEPAHQIVAYTVAGMRWNLMCKELAEARNES